MNFSGPTEEHSLRMLNRIVRIILLMYWILAAFLVIQAVSV